MTEEVFRHLFSSQPVKISPPQAPTQLTIVLFSAMVSCTTLGNSFVLMCVDQEKVTTNAMADALSWRDMLKSIIKDQPERERIATALRLNPLTLTRWSLPLELRAQFIALVQQEDPSFRDEAPLEASTYLDPDFLRGVWKMRAETSPMLLFWTLCKHVLQHALRQLDPERAGMSITVAQCMPPAQDGMISSLREVFGRGTPPWPAELEREVMFLGAESLAGYVVSRGRSEAIGDLRTEATHLPSYRVGPEVSAAAFPLLYTNRVAGCLLVSSTIPYYFASSSRYQLIQDYAFQITEAFTPEQFYPLEQIRLRLMPSFEVQHRLLVTLQDRIYRRMLHMRSDSTQPQLTRLQAESLTWQELEKELLESIEEQYHRQLWSEKRR
jgi:hypothetical protein